MKKKLLLTVLVLFSFSQLKAQYVVDSSYFGANEYIEYIPGNLPIIFVAPHGGYLKPDLPMVKDRGRDNGTQKLAFLLRDTIPTITGGCYPHIIINHLHPSKLNPVHKDSTVSAGSHPDAMQAWVDFHNFIKIAKSEVTNSWGAGHYFELHGNGHASKRNEVGLGISKKYLNQSDSVIKTRGKFSTAKNLWTVSGVDFLEVIKGPMSLGGLLDSKGWKSVPSPSHPSPGATIFFFAGGNTWKHGSRFSGTIDATHLETYWAFMVGKNRKKYAADLASAVITFMETHYNFTLNCNTVGIEEDIELEPDLVKIYPNPCNKNSVINFTNKEKIKNVKLLSSAGLVINSFNPCNGKLPDGICSGVYFVVTELHSGQVKVLKLVVK